MPREELATTGHRGASRNARLGGQPEDWEGSGATTSRRLGVSLIQEGLAGRSLVSLPVFPAQRIQFRLHLPQAGQDFCRVVGFLPLPAQKD